MPEMEVNYLSGLEERIIALHQAAKWDRTMFQSLWTESSDALRYRPDLLTDARTLLSSWAMPEWIQEVSPKPEVAYQTVIERGFVEPRLKSACQTGDAMQSAFTSLASKLLAETTSHIKRLFVEPVRSLQPIAIKSVYDETHLWPDSDTDIWEYPGVRTRSERHAPCQWQVVTMGLFPDPEDQAYEFKDFHTEWQDDKTLRNSPSMSDLLPLIAMGKR